MEAHDGFHWIAFHWVSVVPVIIAVVPIIVYVHNSSFSACRKELRWCWHKWRVSTILVMEFIKTLFSAQVPPINFSNASTGQKISSIRSKWQSTNISIHFQAGYPHFGFDFDRYDIPIITNECYQTSIGWDVENLSYAVSIKGSSLSLPGWNCTACIAFFIVVLLVGIRTANHASDMWLVVRFDDAR